MPTYEYRCEQCGHEFEQFQAITAKPIRKCPSCGKNQVKRLIGTGSAMIFKGNGFYQTDYRSESYQKAAKAEKESACPAASSCSQSEQCPKNKANQSSSAEEKS